LSSNPPIAILLRRPDPGDFWISRTLSKLAVCSALLAIGASTVSADVRISEIHYAPVDPSLEFVEIVSTGGEVDLSNWAFTDGISFVFAPGARLGPGERAVICRDRAVLADRAGLPVDRLLGDFSGALSNGGERLRIVDADGAVVDELRYDDEAPWDPAADLTGRTLERLCLTASSHQAGNWRASDDELGTPLRAHPGEACPAPPPGVFSPVIVTEISYHPTGDRDEQEEFVELYNRTDDAVDIDGWMLSGAVDHTFDAKTGPASVPANGFLLVARSPDGLSRATGAPVDTIAGPWEGGLSNWADDVELLDARGRRVELVPYRQDGLWPARADGFGPSLQRVSTEHSGFLPQNWQVAGQSFCADRTTTDNCVLVDSESVVRWFENLDGGDPGFAGPAEWFEPDFDDRQAGWRDGRLGIGFDTNAAEIPDWIKTRSTVRAGLHSILARVEFDWDPDAADCDSAIPFLAIDRDDGFVAWLNGVEIARGAMSQPEGEAPPFDGNYYAEIYTAVGILDSEPGFETVWRGDERSLRRGRNVLAIGNYNSRNTSSDLYFSARLTIGARPSTGDLTPGSASSVAARDLPALVASVEHVPAHPESTDDVVLIASVETANDADVVAVLEVDGEQNEFPLHDDGVLPDEHADDGIFTVELPRQPNDTLVRYRVEARGASCGVSFPRRSDPSPWSGYYVQDDRPTTNDEVDLYYIFTPGALADLSCSSGARREGTFVDPTGRVYFDIGVKFRGETACNYPKKPIRVEFNKGALYLGQTDVNFMAGWNDKAMLREKLGFDLFRDAGIAYSATRLARVHTIGGRFHGAYFTIEDPSTHYLRRNDWDADGALFKCRTAMRSGGTGGYEPRSSGAPSRLQEVSRFAAQLNSSSGAALVDFINERVNVEAFIDYQAPQVIMIDGDSVVKNWLLYLGPHGQAKTGTARVTCFAWDIDLSHGQMYLTQDQRHHTIHPLFQTQQHPFVGQGHHGLVHAVLQRAPSDYYVKAYYGRMWTLLQEKYNPAVLFPKIDAYDAKTIETVRADLARWVRNWGARGNDPSYWRTDLRNWARRRYDFLTSYLTSTNLTTSGRRFRYTPAPRLRFTEIHYNPPGSESFEFLEIRNLEDRDVDLGGWTIPAIEYEFPKGSTAPGSSFIIVAKDLDGFAVIHGPPDGTLPVFGPYTGNLRNAGEELRLRDNGEFDGKTYYPETIDVVRFDDQAPWPTEADGEGRSLELRDLSLDNDLAESWQASPLAHGSPGALTLSNRPPAARVHLSATSGPAPLRVEFDATESFDPDDDEFTAKWDFGDGIVGAGLTVARTYRRDGVFNGTLTLDDGITRPTVWPFEIRVGDDTGIRFVRGDVRADASVDVGDIIALLFGLYLGSPLDCHDAADVNDDGALEIDDAIDLIAFLFQQGPAPPTPSPLTGCAPDATEDDALSCERQATCE